MLLKLLRASIAGIIFAVSIVFVRLLLQFLGIEIARLPLQAPESIAIFYLFGGCILLAFAMVPIALGIADGFLTRWTVLVTFLAGAFSISTTIESAIYSSVDGMMLMLLVLTPPTVVLSITLAYFLDGNTEMYSFSSRAKKLRAGGSWRQWPPRLLLAILAFPLIYFIFGLIASPLVVSYYASEVAGLALPDPSTILATQLLRGTIHLIVAIPVIIMWRKSKRMLVASFAVAFFASVFTYDIILANQLPLILTLVHGIEVLASSFVYSFLLVRLLVPDEYLEAGTAP